MEKNGKNKGIIGALSAFYMALSYLVGIVIFLVVLKYPEITSDLDKIRLLYEYKHIFYYTNILMYILFGPVLIMFILSLKGRFKENSSLLLSFSAIIGYIWAGSLIACGMVSNYAIEPVLAIYNNDAERASWLWKIFDTVSIGIGNGSGEILGGIFTFSLSIFALKSKHLNKFINVIGIIAGIAGIISIIPILNALVGVFAITQIIWFIAIGIFFLKRSIENI